MGLVETTAATGLYQLKKGGAVFNELKAFEAGLELVNRQIERLEHAPFASQMDTTELKKMCALYGIRPAQHADDSAMKLAILAWSAPCRGNLKSIEAVFQKMGCDIRLEERPNRCIAVQGAIGGIFNDGAQLCRMVGKLVPPDAKILDELGVMTWKMLDGMDMSCEQLNQKNFTWSWLATCGHLLKNS